MNPKEWAKKELRAKRTEWTGHMYCAIATDRWKDAGEFARLVALANAVLGDVSAQEGF
ncbi:MAG: hypothetical protein MUP90_18160 [Gammaproteobacteria bacterium]|nr:hypothetical protein [Gammaproteobacteria bacterium]